MESLGEALPEQQERVRGILAIARQIGPAGNFLAAVCQQALSEAEAAVMSGDLARMIRSYEELKGISD